MSASAGSPLAGIQVVEASLETSVVGAGLATHLPGALMRDFGAQVTAVRSSRPFTLDTGVEFARVWDRGKEIVRVGENEAAETITRLAGNADVLFLSGPEAAIERRGLTSWALAEAAPRLVTVRIRPSVNAAGPMPDLDLLVHARAGLLTQIRGHRPGPVFAEYPAASAGAALSATVGALACLYEREATGVGGWVETSLYDGVLALLPMIIGRVEHASPSTRLLWENQGPAESLSYRCADAEYVQLWFGAKGAYEAFLAHMGEPPTKDGYTADIESGAMAERDRRWVETFASKSRSWWLEDLSGHAFRCEPVWRPGEALSDPHVRKVAMSIDCQDPERGDLTVLGPVARVSRAGPLADGPASRLAPVRLLSDVRVLDLSAYLAGPVAPLVLAELGADVVKVEPVSGDVHRSVHPMYAAGQRGKRTVAIDLKAPGAGGVLERLFGWADVVHHNSRLGLAERLGYDEAAARSANPAVVYSFASGFGPVGPRAALAANDHLMQALSGIEAAQGGAGRPPTFLVWGAIDVASGWLSAASIIAGLIARRRSGEGQSVSTSLFGAALLLKSGTFVAGGSIVSGPTLDADQRGYGAAYRLYQGSDGEWFALGVPDQATWDRLRSVVPDRDLGPSPPALRPVEVGCQPEEEVLEARFATKPAVTWVAALRDAGVPVEEAPQWDRSAFVSGILDDPVNRQLGRVVGFGWGDRGRVEQPWFPMRFGPMPRPTGRRAIAGLGEHTAEILSSVGIGPEAQARLAAEGVVPPPPT